MAISLGIYPIFRQTHMYYHQYPPPIRGPLEGPQVYELFTNKCRGSPCRIPPSTPNRALLKRLRVLWWKDTKPPRVCVHYPICSMYGIFTYIWVIFRANVGKYSIHGAFGYDTKPPRLPFGFYTSMHRSSQSHINVASTACRSRSK